MAKARAARTKRQPLFNLDMVPETREAEVTPEGLDLACRRVARFLLANPADDFASDASGDSLVVALRVGRSIHVYDARVKRMGIVRVCS